MFLTFYPYADLRSRKWNLRIFLTFQFISEIKFKIIIKSSKIHHFSRFLWYYDVMFFINVFNYLSNDAIFLFPLCLNLQNKYAATNFPKLLSFAHLHVNLPQFCRSRACSVQFLESKDRQKKDFGRPVIMNISFQVRGPSKETIAHCLFASRECIMHLEWTHPSTMSVKDTANRATKHFFQPSLDSKIWIDLARELENWSRFKRANDKIEAYLSARTT